MAFLLLLGQSLARAVVRKRRHAVRQERVVVLVHPRRPPHRRRLHVHGQHQRGMRPRMEEARRGEEGAAWARGGRVGRRIVVVVAAVDIELGLVVRVVIRGRGHRVTHKQVGGRATPGIV